MLPPRPSSASPSGPRNQRPLVFAVALLLLAVASWSPATARDTPALARGGDENLARVEAALAEATEAHARLENEIDSVEENATRIQRRLERVRTRLDAAREARAASAAAITALEAELARLREAGPAASASAAPASASNVGGASVGVIREHIAFLASDALAGRDSGEAGLEVAAEYIANLYREYGLEPAGDNGTYFHHFTVAHGARFGGDSEARLTLPDDGRLTWREGSDAEAFAYGAGASRVEDAPVVFAGYGIRASRGGDELQYDDYAGVDAQGKVVLIFRYHPRRGKGEQPFGDRTNRYAAFVAKLEQAERAGAAGLVIVTPPGLDEEDPYSVAHRAAPGAPRVPTLFVRRRAVDELFRRIGRDLSDAFESIEESTTPASFDLDGVRMSFTTGPRHLRLRNVVGRLPGSDPERARECIVVGGHYDHIGRYGNQVANDNLGEIHNGADDNASGTAGALEVARLLARDGAPARSVIFNCFSGEEIGLHGSREWVSAARRFVLRDVVEAREGPGAGAAVARTWGAGSYLTATGKRERGLVELHDLAGNLGWVRPDVLAQIAGPEPLHNIIAMVNLDMIGRANEEGRTTVFGTHTAEGLRALVEELGTAHGVPLELPQGGLTWGGSDHMSFQSSRVPVLFFHTGLTETYNTPGDDLETLNLPAQARICDVVTGVVRRLGSAEAAPEFAAGADERPRRGERRRYLGVNVDREFDGAGVRVADIVAESVATRAGVRPGDVILRFDEAEVNTYEDLVGAIREHGEGKIQILVERDGEKLELEAEFPGG